MHDKLSYNPKSDNEDYDTYGDPVVSGRFTLVYLTADGRQIGASAKGPWVGEMADGTSEIGHSVLKIKPLIDYNHDGINEVLVSKGTELDDPRWFVATVKGSAIIPYPGLDSIHVKKVEDVDHDGLPDLLTHGPFEHEYGDEVSRFIYGPRFLLHAHADGTFAYDPEPGRAALRKRCPRVPRRLEGNTREQTFVNLACGRVYSIPTKQLRADVKRLYTHLGGCKSDDLHAWECAALFKWAAKAAPILLVP